MSYSCSDFTDDVVSECVRLGLIDDSAIPEDESKRTGRPCTARPALPALVERIATLTAAVKDGADLIEEAHDTHIYDTWDEHPADCVYCAHVRASRALLASAPRLQIAVPDSLGGG